MRAVLAFLTVGTMLLSASATQAAHGKSKVEDSPEIVARKACAEGDYKKAISILADLFVHSKDPTHIYNQGRCYQQNHQWVSAIDRFREYLRKAKRATAEERGEAEQHIAECQQLLAEEQARNAPPPPPVTPPPVAPIPPPPTVPEAVVTTPSPSSPPAATASSGSGLRTGGIIVGVVGVATLGGAIALNVKANQLANDGDADRNRSYKNGALACYGIGGAAVATGVILYWLGHRGRVAKPAEVALAPAFVPGGAALVVAGGF